MASVLDRTTEGMREDLAVREARISYDEIKELSLEMSSPIDTAATLTRPGVRVTAEVKRAFPSKGELADIPSPDALATEHEQDGAAVIPCLTEERRLRGPFADLDAVRRTVNIPVLRRDFIVTPYQVHETRAHDVDLMLLMCSALDQPTLGSLLDRTGLLGANALVEAYIVEEVERAEAADAKIPDISARNLETLDADLSVYGRLASMLPDRVVKVAESGAKGPEELHYYALHGADTVLVGKDLATVDEPGEACRRLVTAGVHPTLRNEW